MKRALLAWAILAGAWAGVRAAPGSASAPPHTILLAVFDTTRRDEIGAFGGAAGVTPSLDALARRGLAYDAAFAPDSFTFPSHAAMFTGRLTGSDYLMPAGAMTETLRGLGYRTLGASANWVLDASSGFDRGFDSFTNVVDAVTRAELARGEPDAERRRERATADAVVETITPRLETVSRDDRLFVFVNFLDPHDPYTPGPRARERFAQGARASGHLRGPDGSLRSFLRDAPRLAASVGSDLRRLYRAEVFQADAAFGTLLETLRARRDPAGILVVAVADHGELLGEGNAWTHNLGLSEPEVHVPLLVAGPGVAAGRTAEPVGLAALREAIETWARDGVWRVSPEPPLLFHRSYPGNEIAGDPFTGANVAGIAVGDFRLVRGPHGCRLFARSPGYWRETTCRPTEDPAASLVARLNDAFRTRVGVARLRSWTEAPPSPEWLARLKQLGYLTP